MPTNEDPYPNDEVIKDSPDEGEDLPSSLTPEQKRKAARLLADVARTVGRHNMDMLGTGTKGKSHADRVNSLFTTQRLSPLTELVILCRIERAKVYLWNKVENEGGDTTALPKPNMKLYIQLLDKLVQYEVPNLKSIDITGKVDVGMRVHLVQFSPEQKVIEIDSEAPEKLRLQAHRAGIATLPGATVKLVDSGLADILKMAVDDDI